MISLSTTSGFIGFGVGVISVAIPVSLISKKNRERQAREDSAKFDIFQRTIALAVKNSSIEELKELAEQFEFSAIRLHSGL